MSFTIPDFSRVRVLVAGDAMLDEYWFGDTARISPEAPVPIVRTRSAEQRAGGAANVALNTAALGAQTVLVGIVGADDRGKLLETLLVQRGVRCELVRSASLPTVHKLRVLARNQQLIRLDAEQSLEPAAPELGVRFAKLVKTVDVVVLSDYAKGTLSRAAELIAQCRAARVPVLVDPKGTDFQRYRGAFALTPNRGEFEAVVGRCATEDELLSKGRKLRVDLELEALLVTRGDQGMTLFTAAEPHTLPTQAREVFDVTGAGDTVIAVLALASAAGATLREAAELANLAGGFVVLKFGTATLSSEELVAALRESGR